MDQICVVMPVLPGRADYARDFIGELQGGRKSEYERAARRTAIDKQVWFLASGPHEIELIAYMEAADLANALSRLSVSRDEFDVWLRRSLDYVTGIDLNESVLPLPELLSAYPRESD
jgi:hypothetical protein